MARSLFYVLQEIININSMSSHFFSNFCTYAMGKNYRVGSRRGEEKSNLLLAAVQGKMVFESVSPYFSLALNQMGMSQEEKQKPHFLGC